MSGTETIAASIILKLEQRIAELELELATALAALKEKEERPQVGWLQDELYRLGYRTVERLPDGTYRRVPLPFVSLYPKERNRS